MDYKNIIGIMGPGESARTTDRETAFELGRLLAESGYIVLTGGRACGVMEAAMKGAKKAGGITIGILPSEDGTDASDYIDIPIKTGLGSARNNINVLTSDIVVSIGIGFGTASEISLAMKAAKPILLMNTTVESLTFYRSFGYNKLMIADSTDKAINYITSYQKK